MKKLIILLTLVLSSFASADVFDDGSYHLINYTINDDVWVDQFVSNNPGTQIELVDNGSTDDIWAYNYSVITISGGIVYGELRPNENTTLTITGGQIYDLLAFDSSTVTMSGGLIQEGFSIGGQSAIATISGGAIGGDFGVYDDATIILVGSNFSVDGTLLSYGENLRDYGVPGTDPWGNSCLTGTVTGTLAYSSALNNVFYIHEDADMFVTPEPATLLLLGLGGLILRRRK